MTNRMHPDDLRATMAATILSGMWALPADSMKADTWNNRFTVAAKDVEKPLEALEPAPDLASIRADAYRAGWKDALEGKVTPPVGLDDDPFAGVRQAGEVYGKACRAMVEGFKAAFAPPEPDAPHRPVGVAWDYEEGPNHYHVYTYAGPLDGMESIYIDAPESIENTADVAAIAQALRRIATRLEPKP